MKNVVEGAIPNGFRTEFEEALFNTELHRKTQSRSGWHSFHLVDPDKQRALASVHFCIKGNAAVSPPRAPFGSFEWSAKLDPSALYEFISEVESKLRAKGVTRVELRHPPMYEPRQHMAVVFLSNLGYEIANSEVGAFIPVTSEKLEDKLHAWPGRKWKQAKQLGLQFEKLSLQHLKEVYDFISAAREERGYALSMNKADLVATVTKCRKHFHLFGIFQERELVAACISVQVTRNVLYNFYLAHSRRTDKISPVVALLNGIYAWCQQHHIQWIDLGTSAIDGEPNFSLLEFKLRMGALPVGKFTFIKQLE